MYKVKVTGESGHGSDGRIVRASRFLENAREYRDHHRSVKARSGRQFKAYGGEIRSCVLTWGEIISFFSKDWRIFRRVIVVSYTC